MDLLVLSHGSPNAIIGYQGKAIAARSFAELIAQVQRDPALLGLPPVWQMNCHGATMLHVWRALGRAERLGHAGRQLAARTGAEPLFAALAAWRALQPGRCPQRRRVALLAQGLPARGWGNHTRLLSSRPIVFGADTDFGSDRIPRRGVGASAAHTPPAP